MYFFFARQILAMHLTESNKIIFICSVDLVCGVGISGHQSSSLLAVSHGPIQKFILIYKKITGIDTLKHCQSLGPRIL